MYCAVTVLCNTVSVPSVTTTESLVQVTVVAGPPAEVHCKLFPVPLKVTDVILTSVMSPNASNINFDNVDLCFNE